MIIVPWKIEPRKIASRSFTPQQILQENIQIKTKLLMMYDTQIFDSSVFYQNKSFFYSVP